MSVQDTFSYDVGKKYFPNADENVLHAWLGSDIRIIFLFTDVGSSRFRGFITFLRFVGNIFFYIGINFICKCSSLSSIRATAKPILMQQTMQLVNSLNSFIREAVHSK